MSVCGLKCAVPRMAPPASVSVTTEPAGSDFAAAHRALDVATHLGDRFELPRLHAHILAERVPLLIGQGLIRDAERCLVCGRAVCGVQSCGRTFAS